MDLYSDLDSIVPDYRRFLGITEGDLTVLLSIWPHIAPELDDVLVAFHDRTSLIDGLGDYTYAERSALIDKQKRNITMLFTSRLGEDYVRSTMRMAISYRVRDLPFGWYIAGSAVFSELIRAKILGAAGLDNALKFQAQEAVLKLVALDTALAASAYNAALLD
ncbi:MULTISPECIES: protoglobin family protein [Pseudovibrio]|uniref:protoglobin family protein n=1 Tax=Stappiaceae TaxID=2821832 RepID=UPI0023654276|nr:MULTISPECIES: protoglobin family protein [Pseudovibrio]MDD7910826.1 protoglobin family protein [Pseudovibrio exalbescens]MDX5593466.1 protoglobin family protein [Pseudovibrio sp. SPO723]